MSALVPALDASGAFAVNVLAEDQLGLARAFSRRATADFTGLLTQPGQTGAVILSDALAYFDCQVIDRFTGGDHLIVVGKVAGLGVLRDTRPLAFFRSGNPRFEESP